MNPYFIGAAALILFGGGLYVGRLTVEVPVEKAAVKADQGQIQQEAKQLATNSQADATHDQEIEHPPTLLIKQPVWLREPAAICLPLPAAPASPTPTERPVDPGPAIDLRPELAAFAKKYEAVIADCRRMVAEWPR